MMETMYGVPGTVTDGIFFTEKTIQNAKRIKQIDVSISRQNSNLTAVKKKMAMPVGKPITSMLIVIGKRA